MKINQAVEFFVTGLDRKSEKQDLVSYGKENSLGKEDFLAKIFNFGNDGAYISCVKGENELSHKFSLGISKHRTNLNQKKDIQSFLSELTTLKNSLIDVTADNIGYSLFVTKNVHLKEFYSVLSQEKEQSQKELDENQKHLVIVKKQRAKGEVSEVYKELKIKELNDKQIKIKQKLSFIEKVELCNESSLLKTLLSSNIEYDLLNNVLMASVKSLFKSSIEQINALSKEDIDSISFELVSTNQPHVEIVALNSLLDDKNTENPFTKFTVGLDRNIGDIASCPGCRSYFEGIKERNEVNILYISHTQLPRDFNLNGILEQRKYDFLCKFKAVVLSIFPDIGNNGTINSNKNLIKILDEVINNKDKLSGIFSAYEDLSSDKHWKDGRHHIVKMIDKYLSKEIGTTFYNAAKNFKEEDKIVCKEIFSNLESAIIKDLLSQYARVKGKNPEHAENIQKYIFSKFDNILPTFELQYKGENIDIQEGLCKDDIEYNLELIKKSTDNNLVKEKIMSISDIKIGKNQKLYIINPESKNSKFFDILINLEQTNVTNANVQIDNSTCADHSLILLTKILQCNIHLHQIGIVGMENEYGKHASLYIIVDNDLNLSSEIDEVITSYKQEGEIVDKFYYSENLLINKDVLSDNLSYISTDIIGDNMEHI